LVYRNEAAVWKARCRAWQRQIKKGENKGNEERHRTDRKNTTDGLVLCLVEHCFCFFFKNL